MGPHRAWPWPYSSEILIRLAARRRGPWCILESMYLQHSVVASCHLPLGASADNGMAASGAAYCLLGSSVLYHCLFIEPSFKPSSTYMPLKASSYSNFCKSLHVGPLSRDSIALSGYYSPLGSSRPKCVQIPVLTGFPSRTHPRGLHFLVVTGPGGVYDHKTLLV